MNRYAKDWGELVVAMDRNDVCGVSNISGVGCALYKSFIKGVKPVDGPEGEVLLGDAILSMVIMFPYGIGLLR